MQTMPARILIMGGTSGIGLACARKLAASGAEAITLIGRDHQRGSSAAHVVGPTASFIVADCADPAVAQAAVARAAKQMGGVDAMVCSPGATVLPELLHEQSIFDIQTALTRDLAPALYVCRATLDVMRAQKAGVICAVASDAGKVATPGEAVIGANMAALIQFIRTLAIEAKRDGVRANVVTPSLVEGTPLTERLMAPGKFSAKLFSKARAMSHLGPTTADDVADAVLFMLSPQAARITGQSLSVNGGISAA